MADYPAQFVDATPEYKTADSYATFLPLPAPAISYAQRVWSTGTLVWCYYVGDITSTPLASQTTPPWVGSAVRHELLGPV